MKMKAAVYYKNDHVELQEVERPSIGDGEILMQMKACGVCVADTMEWYQMPKAPVILGHEATGVVAEIGAGVEGFAPGDRIVAHHHVGCMCCEHCLDGNYTVCDTFKKSNYRPGGFAEYIALSPLHVKMDTYKLPEQVSFEAGTLVEPLSCVVHAVRRMDIKPQDRVAIIGAGSIGILFAQTLRAYGVREIVVYETNGWRAEKARAIAGVPVFCPAADPKETLAAYREQTGMEGVTKSFVIAKDLRAMQLGITIAGRGASVMLFATPADDEYLEFYVSEAFFKELTVKLSYSADHLDTREALALIVGGNIDAESLITHRYPLSAVSEGILQTASRGQALKCVISLQGGML